MNRFSGLRDFLVIWAGQMISSIGSRLSIFAMGIWVLRTTGSTTQFALIYLAMDLPLILVAPFAGAMVDRWDRRRVMIVCDSLCAATTFALVALLASQHLAIWHLYVGCGLMALCTAFHGPAFQASIPLRAGEEHLPRVNGLVQTGEAVASIVGPLMAGVMVSLISLHGVLAVDALTFAFAAGALALARIPRPPRVEEKEPESVLKEAAIGWRYIHERRGLMGLLVLGGLKNFVFSIASVLITPLLLSFADPALVGVQYAISGAGLLLGGLAMTALGAPRKRVPAMLALMFVCGLFLAIHGVYPSFVLVVAAGFVMFLTLPGGAVLNTTLWQRKVPPELQGRCFSLQQVLANAATPLGYGVAGLLSERVFEPLLAPNGALAGSVGAVIGTGAGRGIGLMFIVLGVLLMAAAAVASSVTAIRRVDELPDAVAMQDRPDTGSAPTPTEEGGGPRDDLPMLAPEAR